MALAYVFPSGFQPTGICPRRLRSTEHCLLLHMLQGGPKAFTKEQYRQLALVEVGRMSKASFDDA